jgi:hypothetical protein
VRAVGARLAEAAVGVIERRRLVVSFAAAAEALRNSDVLDAWQGEVEGHAAALESVQAATAARLSRSRVDASTAKWAAGARERMAEKARRALAAAMAARQQEDDFNDDDDGFDEPETPTARMVVRRTHPHIQRPRFGTPSTISRTAAATGFTPAGAPNTPAAAKGAVPPGPTFAPATTRRERLFQNTFRSVHRALEAGDPAAASPAALSLFTPAQLGMPAGRGGQQPPNALPSAMRSEPPRPRTFAMRLREQGYVDPARGNVRFI